ncbi:hypothetical protein ZWY2020_008865 [Hordeum vulgare]|nr:hypothetical protein ZWY2020_008865 [Hordeum vulgare]
MTALSKLSIELSSKRVDRRFFEEEVCQAKHMANGKPYLLQCAFGGNMFSFLMRIWRSSGTFTDLPWSVAEAVKNYATHDGDVELRLLWAQFQSHEPNPCLSYQMKQLMELHRMADPAMKDLCVRLWPMEPLPSSYLGLVQKLVIVLPRIEVLKRSVFIEGARMAFARTMMHWPGVKLLTGNCPPPVGKEHRRPMLYFPFATEGARVIEAQCSKYVLFE